MVKDWTRIGWIIAMALLVALCILALMGGE